MNKTKWGVLGCANFARTRAIPAMLQAKNVEIVGIASRSIEKATEFATEFRIPKAYGSYEALLEDPEIEAIYNPLPNGMHGEWVMKAARAGKHTLCEKPFTSTAAEAIEVEQVVEECGVKVMEAFMWRFHPQHVYAKKVIAEGKIGAVKLVRCAFSFPIPRKSNIRLDSALAGGSIMDVGCYTISGTRHYFGAEPMSVYATAQFDPEYDVDMNMQAVLEYPGGKAIIDCAFDLPFRSDVEVIGETGRIYIPMSWLPNPESSIFVNDEEVKFPETNQYVIEFETFSESVQKEVPLPFGLQDAINQMKVIDAVYRSARSGKTESI